MVLIAAFFFPASSCKSPSTSKWLMAFSRLPSFRVQLGDPGTERDVLRLLFDQILQQR